MIWNDRGYSFEQDWMQGFEKAGCKVTQSRDEADASGYVLLQGVSSTGRVVSELDRLDWLSKKTAKKLALVINAHKLVPTRREFFNRCGIVVGSESDESKLWGQSMFVPCALNPDVYYDRVPRRERGIDIGFRGSVYKTNEDGRPHEREGLVSFFAQKHRHCKSGTESFLHNRDAWASFLNSIKAMPGCEAGTEGHRIPVHRHIEAIGCKVVNVMYPGRYCGVIKQDEYIHLERDHSNMDEVYRQLSDESYCEEMTSRVRQRMCDTNTIAHGVKRILDWLTT